MDKEELKEFFERAEDYCIESYGNQRSLSIEDLYQAFKARLLRELEEEEDEGAMSDSEACVASEVGL